MSDFQPKTETELAHMMCWPEGEYDFEVIEAERKTSKSGKEMLEIELRLFNDKGASITLNDWLVASDHPLPLRKLRHYCAATGSMDAYESGELDNFLGVGASGRCKIKVEDDEQYGPQNRITDYVKRPANDQEPSGISASQPQRASSAIPDSDIPF